MEARFHISLDEEKCSLDEEASACPIVLGTECLPISLDEEVYVIDYKAYPNLEKPIQRVDYFHGFSTGIMAQLVI